MEDVAILPTVEKDLIEWLKLLNDETISDIRKVYKNGVTDSVKETYAKYIK